MSSSALVIFSGGQDSTTCLFWAKKRFERVEALSFAYGQRHKVEIECAKKICSDSEVPHKIIEIDFLSQLSENALTNPALAVATKGGYQNLPTTFVPGRNILFLTMAASYAVPRGLKDVVIGACETDFSGYPDCREKFMERMQEALGEGLSEPLQIHRPLMFLTKEHIFELAFELGCLDTVLKDSHSCYEGDRTTLHAWGYGCGECPACILRRRGFELFQRKGKK